MERKSEYLKTFGKITLGFVPYIGEHKFFEPTGNYRTPLTILFGTIRWTGLLLGYFVNPNAYYAYAIPTVGEEPAIIRDEIFNKRE
jgi:hypothetical protein